MIYLFSKQMQVQLAQRFSLKTLSAQRQLLLPKTTSPNHHAGSLSTQEMQTQGLENKGCAMLCKPAKI
jgi:hypothetical protein